jgi:tetratricopeptide (TPR) repeat protein
MFRIAIAVLLLAAPLSALGQGEPGGGATKEEAAKHFKQGKKLFAKGEFEAAAVAFTKAYEAAPHQAVLANIALCYDKAERYVEALTNYRRYLEDPVDKSKNAEIRARVREIEDLVGELDIECSEKNCVVRVDGEEHGPGPVSVVVEPGKHKVEAVVHGDVVVAQIERVDAGKIVRVRLQSQKAGPVFVTAPEAYDSPGETPTDREVTLGIPFWIATGVTVAAGATTVVFGVRTLKARDDYEASGYTDKEAKDRGERDRLITNVLIGVTAAAAATATALAIHDIFFADGDDEEPDAESEPEVALVPGPGVGVGLTGQF